MQKKLLSILAIFTLLISLPIPRAEAVTKRIHYIDSPCNMIVTVYFDKEIPDISFITPDNVTVEATTYDYDAGDDFIQFYMPGAKAGTWIIVYDEKSNTDIEIYISDYVDEITSEIIQCQPAGDNKVSATFSVNSGDTDRCKWKLFAVLIESEDTISKVLLDSGTNPTNTDITVQLDTSGLLNHDEYYLALQACPEDGDFEDYGIVLSETTFAATNHSQNPSDLVVEFATGAGKMWIKWKPADYSEYDITVFDISNNGRKLIYYDSVYEGRNEFSIWFDSSYERNIKIHINGISNDNCELLYTKKINTLTQESIIDEPSVSTEKPSISTEEPSGNQSSTAATEPSGEPSTNTASPTTAPTPTTGESRITLQPTEEKPKTISFTILFFVGFIGVGLVVYFIKKKMQKSA